MEAQLVATPWHEPLPELYVPFGRLEDGNGSNTLLLHYLATLHQMAMDCLVLEPAERLKTMVKDCIRTRRSSAVAWFGSEIQLWHKQRITALHKLMLCNCLVRRIQAPPSQRSC
jgi:hypothetical protein